MPKRGHGFGTGPGGTSSFDVTNNLTESGCTIKYKNGDVGGSIKRGCPVYLNPGDLFTPAPEESSLSAYLNQMGKACPATSSPGTNPRRVAVALTSSTEAPGPGEYGTVGKAFVAGVFPAIIARTSIEGEMNGGYAMMPSGSINDDISDEDDACSGGLVRRHTGPWEILTSVDVPDTELQIAMVAWRGPITHRFFFADITGAESIGDYRFKYSWIGDGSEDATSDETDFAYNNPETYNETDDYASSQLKTNMGDWEIQQVRRRVLMRLDVDKDGVYTATFDQAAQWWGECWE
jgi:hypothetical protein